MGFAPLKKSQMIRKIEYLFPAALETIKRELEEKYGKNQIPSGYQSAISGFGTALRQMGLLPTLAVYTDSDNKASIQRDLLLLALLYIVVHNCSKFPENYKQILKNDENIVEINTILNTVAVQDKIFQYSLKQNLLEAALAFKLAIRTFNLK